MSRNDKLPFALRDGVPVHIKDVPSGLDCGCVCPAYGARLIARKGSKRAHHFAHHAAEDCEHGYETSLHLWAKEILSKAKEIWLPAVCVEFPGTHREAERLSEETPYKIESVEIVEVLSRPALKIHVNNDHFFYLLIKTNKSCKNDYWQLTVSTVELDLTAVGQELANNDFSVLLLNPNDKKTWVYSERATRKLKYYEGMATTIPLNHSTLVCPAKKISQPAYDCLRCPYIIAIDAQTPPAYHKCAYRARNPRP